MFRFERHHIERLPALEQDILHLHLQLDRTHSDIARILGMSQPAVHYRYKRSRSRLEMWVLLPSVTPAEVCAVMQSLDAREKDIQVMMLYVETNNQSEVARHLGVSQGWVRTSLMRSIEKHLERDMSQEDRHVRVRQACKLLVSKPGMFTDTNNPALGHLVKSRENTRKLLTPPKVALPLVLEDQVTIQDGLYRGMEATVEQTDPLVRVRFHLRSQVLRLQWPA